MQDDVGVRLMVLLVVALSVAIIYTPTLRVFTLTDPSLFILSGVLVLVFLFMLARIYSIYTVDEDIDIES